MRRLLSRSSSPGRLRSLVLVALTLGAVTLTPVHVTDSLAQESAAKPSQATNESATGKEKTEESTPQEVPGKSDASNPDPTSVAAATIEASEQDTKAKATTEQSSQEACLVTPPDRAALVQRIKKMRPKSAAKLFAALPPELAADLLLRIDVRQSARIMNELPPHTGAVLVTILSRDDDPLTTNAARASNK